MDTRETSKWKGGRRRLWVAVVTIIVYFFQSQSGWKWKVTTENGETKTNNDDRNSTIIDGAPIPSRCRSQKGSLHQIALDMAWHSSPYGSASLMKLQRVLNANMYFDVSLGPAIFSSIGESMSMMLMGYGLESKATQFDKHDNVTLVETGYSSSRCPITDDECFLHPRIVVQSEQIRFRKLGRCHESPSCVILEFSDRNLRLHDAEGWGDSVVLLPVMTQQHSRLSSFEPVFEELKPLRDRSFDVVFFGAITNRRKGLIEQSMNYTANHPQSSVLVTGVKHNEIEAMTKAYREAKVCVVSHSYATESGGEYHRLSEFAKFGCIPVMETFSGTLLFSFSCCFGHDMLMIDSSEMVVR
jgi:hypothetical protein